MLKYSFFYMTVLLKDKKMKTLDLSDIENIFKRMEEIYLNTY